MILSKIMTEFHEFNRTWVSMFDSEVDIYSFAFLEGATGFENNVLYFGDISKLPENMPDINLTFVCIEDKKLTKAETDRLQGRINLITLDKMTKPFDILRVLTTIFGDAARASSGRSHLIDVLHSNQGINAIVEKAFEILQNPIIVVDSTYKLLAMASGDVNLSLRRDLEEQRQLGYMLKDNIDAMADAHIYEAVREKGYPYYNKEEDSEYGWITALIYIHDIEIGQIGVMEALHPFTETDFEIIDFLSKVISLELQKSDFYRVSPGLMHSYFLSDLLDNKVHDAVMLQQRMMSLGWDMNQNLHVIVLAAGEKSFFEKKAQIISNQLHGLLPNSRWAIYHGQIVFLASFESYDIFTETAQLKNYLTINNLSAAISNGFENILDIRTYYDQAMTAASFGQRMRPDERIHLYGDYIFYHMGEIVGKEQDLKKFYHPSVVAIRDYDREFGTNFLETLKLYLTYIDQPAVIAEKLFVHKNTVFYRISKMKEAFDLNLNDGDERFKIHMTIKLMEME